MLKKFKLINCIQSIKILPNYKKNFLTKSNTSLDKLRTNFFNLDLIKNSNTGKTFLKNIYKKHFSYSLPDEENSHLTKNKPNRLIELNLKKSDHTFVSKMNFPFNDETQIFIFNKIMKNQSVDLISDKIKYEVLLKILLISSYCRENAIYFIIDDDEDGKQIIKLLNDLELDLVWVKNDSQNELFSTPITNRFLFNYKNFKIPKFKENSLIVFLSENKKNLINWINSEEMKNNFLKSTCFFHNKNTEESQLIQSILRKVNPISFTTVKFLNEKQNEILLNFGISHYAMCVKKNNISIVCLENCKKFLRLGKKVLIICENEQCRQELKNKLAEIEEHIRSNGNLSGYIQIRLNNELSNQKTKNDDIDRHDVVIEYPFQSIDVFKERRKYLKRLKWGDVFMLSLYYEKESHHIEELRKMNFAILSVRNLLSATWLYDDNELYYKNLNNPSKANILKTSDSKPSTRKTQIHQNLQNSLPNISPLDFFNKLDTFINTENKLPSFTDDTNNTDFLNLDDLYQKVQKNKYLQKQIFFHFVRQNFKKFFNLEYESISLITGEPGWYTVNIISRTPKQMEERYSVIKFLIQQGVCTMDYEDKVFRVYEKFDHVLDIPCEKFRELKKNAEAANLDVEILNELPIFHRNQFSDLIRHKNKFEEKVKEDLDEQE